MATYQQILQLTSVGVGGYAALPSSCPGRVSPPAIFANESVYIYGNSSFYLACP